MSVLLLFPTAAALEARVTLNAGRSLIMPPPSALTANVQPQVAKITDAVTAAMTLRGLPTTEGLKVAQATPAVSATLSTAGNLLDLPLVQETDNIFTFVGTFSMPAFIQDDGVGAGGLGVSADGNAMYVTSFFGSVAKMTIPSSGTGSSSQIVGWTSTPGSAGENQNKLTAMEYGGEVYCSKYSHYTEAAQSVWIQRGTTSLTGFTGLSATSGQNTRLFSQGFMHIPSAWQSLLGGPVAAMGCRQSIIGNAQCGFSFFVFDPADVGGDVPVVPLLNYPYANALEPVDSSHPDWAGYPKNGLGGTDLVSSANAPTAGMLIVPGSRTLAIITSHGYGLSNNGCLIGESSVNNDPRRIQVVAYDMQDLVDVKNGLLQPHEPQPYDWWEWRTAYGGIHWGACAGGGTAGAGFGVYDPVKGRWYMCDQMSSNDMHTWAVNGLS